MNKYLKLFLSAFSISFLGSIPIGTLNVSIVGLLLNHNLHDAVVFGLGAVLVEMLIVRLAILAVSQLHKFQTLLRALKAIVCLLLFVLAYKSFEAAFHMKPLEDVLPFSGSYPLLAGMLLSLLNPLHLPFWMGWTAILKTKTVLVENSNGYLVYIFAIGLGTCVSFLIYAFAGSFLIGFLTENQFILNWIIGATMLLTGLIQVIKMIRQKLIFKHRSIASPPVQT